MPIHIKNWGFKMIMVVGMLATFIGNIKEIREIITDTLHWIRGFELTLTYSPQDNILSYQIPNHGYISLWNWNGKGEILQMPLCPSKKPQIACTASYALVNDDTPREQPIDTSKAHFTEGIFLLWTPTAPDIMRSPYSTLANFYLNLEELDNYMIKKISLSFNSPDKRATPTP
jgi:hypothetical protein